MTMRLYGAPINLRFFFIRKCLPLMLLSLSMTNTYGQGTVVEDKSKIVDEELFKDIASELRCPTCTGLGVLDSEAPFSIQIRNEVRSQLEKGGDKKSILKFFLDRYGPWILRSPPKQGINWFAWIIPLALLVLGPILIYFFLFRRSPIRASDSVRASEEILIEMQQEISNQLTVNSETKSDGLITKTNKSKTDEGPI